MATVYEAGQARLTIVPDAREFRSKLEADLRKIQVDYAVQISADLARARADLDKFRAEQEARAIHLRAEVDRDHLRRAFDDMRGDFANVGDTLTKALKINAGAVGIDLLPSLATGLASVAQALEQVADAGLAVPGILAGIGASAGSVMLALSGMKDAWSAVSKAANESGADQARQAQQVISSTNSLRNAKVDELHAQRDLADAYRDARHELEDLNISQRGGVLSEKEAILEAQKARRDLATGRYKDSLDYQEAQLRVEEADQHVVESHQRNIELNEKLADANAKGVNGADRVVDAQERVVRALQAVQAAQAAAAIQSSETPAAKAADALSKLAPAAAEAITTLRDLKPTFDDLRNTDAQAVFEGVGGSIRRLVEADLPTLKSGLANIGGAINGDIKQLFASLGSDSSRGILDRILGNTANADSRVRAAIDPVVHAFGTLSAVGSDSLPRLADAVDHVADRFNNFITGAAADGRLSKWISDGLDAFRHLGDTAIHLGETFHGISTALGGKGLLADLDSVTGRMAMFVNSAKGQGELTHLFQEGRDEFHKWEPVIANLAKMMPTVFEAAKAQADTFLPVIKSITDLLAQHPALLQTLIGAYFGWKTVLEPIGSIAKAIGGVSDVVRTLIKDINGVGDAAKKTATVVETAAQAEVAAEEEVGAAAAAEAGAFGTGGAGAAAGAGGAAAAGGLGAVAGAAGAIAGPALALGAGAAITEQQVDKDSVPLGGDPKLAGTTRNDITQADVDKLTVPPGFPKPGSTQAEEAMSGMALKGDLAAKWVVSTQNKWDQAARYAWLANHQDFDNKPDFKPPLKYAAGGGTPHTAGPLPDGGYHAVIHPSEYVLNSLGRQTVGDAFAASANKGVIDTSLLPHFDVGGPGDGFKQFTGIDPNTIDYHGHLVPKPQTAGDWDWLSSTYHAYKSSDDVLHKVPPGFSLPEPPVGIGGPDLSKAPHFGVGGPGDDPNGDVSLQGDPRNAAPNPATLGPQTIAPNPTGAGPGILNSLFGGIASGIQGPIGNAIGLAQAGISMAQSQSGGDSGGGIGGGGGFGGFGSGGGGGGLIPGIWGLAQAGAMSDPQQQQAALSAWGSQTAQWLGNFAGKTLSSAADIGSNFVLGGLGLSGLNSYGQDISKTAGFYLGDQSPFRSLMGSGAAPAGDIGMQTITLGDGSTIQIPTYGTAQGISGLPSTGATPGAVTAVSPSAFGGTPMPGAATPTGDIVTANPASRAAIPLGGTTTSAVQRAGLAPLYKPGTQFGYGAAPPPGAGVPPSILALADQFGLEASTYNEGGSLHQAGFAFDFRPKGGDMGPAGRAKMDAFASFIKNNLQSQTLELIHYDPGTAASQVAFDPSKGQYWGVAGAQDVDHPGDKYQGYFTQGDQGYSGHSDHVHWATDAPVIISPAGTAPGGAKTWWQGWKPGAAAGPIKGASGMGTAELQQAAHAAYLQAGMPANEWGAFQQLISNESGWNPNAQNPGSSAFGLGQFLDSTWRSVGGQKTNDPMAQLGLIFAYLRSRSDYHGSPAAALALWNARSPHWYDDGGMLPTGLTMTMNQTGKPEAVLTPEQTQAYQAVAQHLTNPQPAPPSSVAQVPDAHHLQPTPGATKPEEPPAPAPETPPSTPAAPVPSPGGPSPEIPTPTPTGGAISPSLAAPQVAAAPTNLDHNLKAIDTGIDSAAQAIGQAASTAIGIAASLAGSSDFAPGAGAIGAIGPYVAGAIQEGGKVVKDVVNVPSSFLVGNITSGTQDLAYGAPLRPAQNNPNVGGGVPSASVTNWNISGNYELQTAMAHAELKQAQDSQSYFASHPRTPGT